MASTAEARAAVTTPDRQYKPEPEHIYVSRGVVETAQRQAGWLRQASSDLSRTWHGVMGDAARQKLSEVMQEVDHLAGILSFWTASAVDRGTYIDLEPHQLTEEAGRVGGRTVVMVSAGALSTSVTSLQMLVSCFYPEKREDMRIIMNPKRDALLRKLMNGVPLRIGVKLSKI